MERAKKCQYIFNIAQYMNMLYMLNNKSGHKHVIANVKQSMLIIT